MDTNIENYSTDEILDIIKIDKGYNFEMLYGKIKFILSNLNDEENNNLYKFFIQCFKKITDENEMKIPHRILKEFELIDPNTIDPNLIDLNKNNSVKEMVPSRIYPGAVPKSIPESLSLNTNVSHFTKGLVNPLQRETIKKILTINSKFRYNCHDKTTDFSIDLNEDCKNVVSIKLSSLEMINSYYTFSDYLKTNIFTIITYNYDTTTLAKTNITTHEIIITEGNYSTIEMQNYLNTQIFITSPLNIVTTEYNSIKGKFYFRLVTTPPAPPPGTEWGFDLDFSIKNEPNRQIYENFGWLLGYRKFRYTFFPESKQQNPPSCFKPKLPYYHQPPATPTYEIGYNPEAFSNFNGTNFYLLELNDYNRNVSEVLNYNINSKTHFSVRDIIAKVPNTADQLDIIFEDSSDKIFKTRKYFGPVNIKKLHIKLLDENGKVVDLNNGEIIVSLEIQILTSPYKNAI